MIISLGISLKDIEFFWLWTLVLLNIGFSPYGEFKLILLL